MRAQPHAISVQLTIAGFLSSTLILDWLRPGMLAASHRALTGLVPIVVPCLFGLIGFLLGAITACRRRGFAVLLTTLLAPFLGAVGATIIRLAAGRNLQHDDVAIYGAAIGTVFVPVIILTWLRMQAQGNSAVEVASHQRASWSVVLLALALLQILVAVAATHFRSDRTDVSSAIGILCGSALIAVCIADRRAIRSMRAAFMLADERSSEVDPSVFERVRTNYAGNVACSIFAWLGIVGAHLIGGAKYSLV